MKTRKKGCREETKEGIEEREGVGRQQGRERGKEDIYSKKKTETFCRF